MKKSEKKETVKKAEKKATALKKTPRKAKAEFKNREVIFLIIVTCIVSLLMGLLVGMNNSPSNNDETDRYLKKFEEKYKYILDNYYGDVDEETMLNGAIEGLVSSLGDDYSTYIGEDETDTFNIKLDGSYKGIGIEIYPTDNGILISDVFDDTPASESGLQIGDIITKVDDMDVTNMSTSELSKYIRNSNLEKFNLTIFRNDEKSEITVNKNTVTLKSVMSEVYEKNNKKIGYIYIDIFANATSSQFKNELDKLESEKIDSLIIDVRSNGGGHLTTAIDILSNFFDSKTVICQTESKTETKKYYSTGKTTKKYPIVVLQDELSASAAELLSISLQEQYNATVIGKTSYGKGTVQELVTVGDSQFKFTTKKWLSPNGTWINELGVIPDVEVELNSSYYDDPTDENDNQLQEAINYLAK